MLHALPGWLLVAALPLFAALAVWLWVLFAARRLRLPEFFDEVHPQRTPDGATVVLCRLRPRGAAFDAPPVVLCHGLAMNRRAFALEPARNFAERLAELGRDVWVIELRGATDAWHARTLRQATFDTYAAIDVPLALEQVRAATGAAEVDWVGFSMGGMLAYAHLGARGGGGVRRLVTIGSPVHFERHPIAWGAAIAPLVFAPAQLLTRTPFRFLSLLVAPLMWPGVPRRLSQGLRADHYEAASLRRVMANALASVPTGVSLQFVRWLREGRFDSVDRAFDYFAGLDRITVPTLVIAGSHDRLAPPHAVLDASKKIGRVAVRVIGRATGASRDYDHLDLILGGSALAEVFPHVHAWLQPETPGTAD